MAAEKRGMNRRIRDELVAAAPDGNVFAILDAARIPGLCALLCEMDVEHEELAAGLNGQDLRSVVPYLARLPLAEETFLWFRLQPEALMAALFAVSDEGFASVRRHLKRFLKVEATDGRTLYFRFYDPRILGPFLSACLPQERASFFGPVHHYLARDPDDGDVSDQSALIRWSPDAEVSLASGGGVAWPTAFHKFRLRPEHDAALQADAVARYERRAIAYLRERCTAHVEGVADPQIVEVLHRALRLGGEMGMEAGRDVTMLAEALVQDAEDQVRASLTPLAPELRRAELIRLCERLQP